MIGSARASGHVGLAPTRPPTTSPGPTIDPDQPKEGRHACSQDSLVPRRRGHRRLHQRGAAPPKADAAAVDKEIRDVVTAWNGYIAAQNDSAIGELYANHAVLMPPNQPRQKGKAAIRSFFSGMWVINPTMVLTTDQVVTSDAGDVAIEEGSFASSTRVPTASRSPTPASTSCI